MKLRIVRPCPTPEIVRGEDCDRCGKRVHDLTRSADPAGDVARLGGSACVRVLAAAIALGGCSGATDAVEPAAAPVTITIQPDAGSDAPVVDDPSMYYLGDVSSE
jgi:hypothetical protein